MTPGITPTAETPTTISSAWPRWQHNSVLVNGKGQPKSIEAKGRVTEFFNSPDYCTFTGEAAEAYPGMLGQFDRVVLFVRPDVWLVYDELTAPDPSRFTWLLNAFEAAEIDEAANTMTVRQRDQRLRVQHLAPDVLEYSQSNERPHPMQTKSFCRYTEAFPQQHTIRVTTAEETEERIVAAMDAYDVSTGPAVTDVRRIDADDAIGGGLQPWRIQRDRRLQQTADELGDRGGCTDECSCDLCWARRFGGQ